MTTYMLRANTSTGDTSKPVAVRDSLMIGDNGGVLFCADTGFGWSYPAGSLPRPASKNPESGSTIKDMSSNHNDGVSGSKGNVTHTNNGFDFTGATSYETGIVIPAEVNSQIYNKKFLFCVYAKLPAKADWNATTNIAGIVTSAANGTSYVNAPENFILSQLNNNSLGVRIQKSINSYVNVQFVIPDSLGYFDDEICQIAVWVEGIYVKLRIKNVNDEISGQAGFFGNTADYWHFR